MNRTFPQIAGSIRYPMLPRKRRAHPEISPTLLTLSQARSLQTRHHNFATSLVLTLPVTLSLPACAYPSRLSD